MRNLSYILSDHAKNTTGICLATLVATRGSAPQVPGSSAIFSEQGLVAGTLGGGIMEGDARKKASEAIRNGNHLLYDFHLDAKSADDEGALCGGSATILLDPDPGMHAECFRAMTASLEQGQAGCMVTTVSNQAESPIRRSWMESDRLNISDQTTELQGEWPGLENALSSAMDTGKCTSFTNKAGDLLFIEPIFPLPKLVIAGAGHVGKALSHLARLLDFEVTVVDDRAEYANRENLPDADHIITRPIGEAMSEIPETRDAYIVIVTRGHHDDAAALKACIGHEFPYIGMIGSRKKVRTLKEKFLAEGWSTREQFERVHAPVGIEIGSLTVQEIALSIAAQLVQTRAAVRKGKKREQIAAVILAAGESRRMGKPKMLLPYGDSTIIGTVVRNALNALSDHVRVVLGAGAETVQENIADLHVEKVLNQEYSDGMLSSVQAGIRSLPGATTAVMILLGDQPMISSETMDRLITRYRQSEKDIVVASVDGKRGHPMIFSTKYVPEILAYGPGNTLRDLTGNHPGEVEELETGKPEILRDIDTIQDYKNERSIIR
ncbi:MAG: XdhC family protein [Bacteroidales bacterium]|nr:XdhC family protein [Bacteroidales bacterium]MDT8430734.1 XdhC family protein [Bacteroidales bacterium]